MTCLRPWNLLSASDLRVVNKWCTALFKTALQAKDIDVVNAPPQHQAEAALALYVRAPGNRFGITPEDLQSMRKRKRGGVGGSAAMTLASSIGKHPSSRRAMTAMGVYVSDERSAQPSPSRRSP